MAKSAYKIPDSLDKNFGDMEIAIQSTSGVGVKPLPVKIVLAYIVSTLVCLYIVTGTFVSAGGFATGVLFVIFWAALTFVLLKQDKSGEPQASLILTMINYLPKSARNVICRKNHRANEFYSIAGIESISPKNGFIKFADGSCGYVYLVVGTGSVLLFDDDRDAILDRVDSYFRKVKPDTQHIFITTKEAQKVHRQLDALATRYNECKDIDPDLRRLMQNEYSVLKDFVGDSFKSIHQYLILKADNAEALTIAKNILQSECENSSLMFKRCVALYDEDIYSLLRTIYG